MDGERARATIKNEVITFPAGSKPEEIKAELCVDCRFCPSCTGPREVDGKVQAENKNIANFYNDEYIAGQANCKPVLEGRPMSQEP